MTHDFDARLRTAWHDAADALPGAVQGRLRAARRTALAGTAPRPSSLLRGLRLPAGAFAAVAAVALLAPQLARRPSDPSTPSQAMQGATSARAAAVSARASGDAQSQGEGIDTFALEDDPDFYLWLDGIAPAPRNEVRHDPT